MIACAESGRVGGCAEDCEDESFMKLEVGVTDETRELLVTAKSSDGTEFSLRGDEACNLGNAGSDGVGVACLPILDDALVKG